MCSILLSWKSYNNISAPTPAHFGQRHPMGNAGGGSGAAASDRHLSRTRHEWNINEGTLLEFWSLVARQYEVRF